MTSYESFGRTNQKRRTRAELMAAAAELMSAGETPTVAQAASAAAISKSTAYRYFPSQEALLAEVLLGQANRVDLDLVFQAAATAGTVHARLDAVVRADHALVIKHEAAYRTMLRAVLAGGDPGPTQLPRRPGNRLRYLADALAPAQGQLAPELLERLVVSLAMCVGIESVLVTTDICTLSTDAAVSIKRWAAAALLDAALRESGGPEDL